MASLLPDETLLGLLADPPRHGYQLLEIFEDPVQLGAIWKASTSQLYAVLKRLEREGWITGVQIESESAPTRTEYRLTSTGQARLNDWLHEPNPSASIRRVRVEFLSRLFIAHQLGIPTESLIQRQKAACQAALDQMRAQDAVMEPGVARLSQAFAMAQLESVLGWIDTCESIPVRS